MDLQRELDEDVLVSEAGFLESIKRTDQHVFQDRYQVWKNVLFSGELILLKIGHELGSKSECPQAKRALCATAGIVNKEDRPLVHLLLVVILVLDDVEIHEIAHVGAGVPSHVVRIRVHLPQHLDHFRLVNGICLRAGSRRCGIRGGVGLDVRLSRGIDNGEGE